MQIQTSLQKLTISPMLLGMALLLGSSFLTACSWKSFGTTVGVLGAAGAGAAAVYYAKGDLESDQPYSIDRVYDASVRALQSRGYTVKERDAGAVDRHLIGEVPGADDSAKNKVTVKLKRSEERVTHVSIRVGVFGDEALSRSILEDIQHRL